MARSLYDEFKEFKDTFGINMLTEENVHKVYNQCFPSDSTKRIAIAQLYQKELCGVDSPQIKFDYNKVLGYIPVIHFMLGQLRLFIMSNHL